MGRSVARAYRACALARGAEAFLVGVFATLLTLAAAGWQGAALAAFSTWAVALGCGVFGGAGWWLETRPTRGQIARRIDAELALDGAFFTAWEATGMRPVESTARPGSGSAPASDLARLLAVRLSARLARRGAPHHVERAALPNSLPLLALPLVATALLAAVRSSDPPPAVPVDWAPRVTGFAASVDDVEAAALRALEAGEIDAETLRQISDLNDAARELRRRARSGQLEPEAASAELERLRGELERRAAELSPVTELARSVERAATGADALLSTIPDRDPGSDAPPRGAQQADGERAGPRSETGSETDPELTGRPSRGTMMDRSEPVGTGPEDTGTRGAPGSSPGAAPGPGPAGLAVGRWWTQRDAAVVERWQAWLGTGSVETRPGTGDDDRRD